MLDTFFRKYAWLANAALLVAAAWLTARTVNTVAAAAIRPRPHVDLSALPAAPPPVAQATLEAEKLYALFGQKPPRPPDPAAAEPPAPTTPQNCGDRRAAAARSSLRAQLVAAVLAERPEWSIASITDLNTRETRIYGVGDQVLGSRFMGIDRLRDPQDATGAGFRLVAVVCNSGTKEYVDFEGGTGTPAGPVAMPMPGIPAQPPGAGAPDLAGIKKLAENRYEIPKGVIDRSLTDLNAIATQARIVPSFKNGVANGFKLFSIQPGSLYSSIGIDNGDVIQRINGYEINSPDKALEIYQKLREAAHITIDIERNGQTIRKDYNVTP